MILHPMDRGMVDLACAAEEEEESKTQPKPSQNPLGCGITMARTHVQACVGRCSIKIKLVVVKKVPRESCNHAWQAMAETS